MLHKFWGYIITPPTSTLGIRLHCSILDTSKFQYPGCRQVLFHRWQQALVSLGASLPWYSKCKEAWNPDARNPGIQILVSLESRCQEAWTPDTSKPGIQIPASLESRYQQAWNPDTSKHGMQIPASLESRYQQAWNPDTSKPGLQIPASMESRYQQAWNAETSKRGTWGSARL